MFDSMTRHAWSDDEATAEHDYEALERELSRRRYGDEPTGVLLHPAPSEVPAWVSGPQTIPAPPPNLAPPSFDDRDREQPSYVRLRDTAASPSARRTQVIERTWHDVSAARAMAATWQPLLEDHELPDGADDLRSQLERAASRAAELILAEGAPLSTEGVWPELRRATYCSKIFAHRLVLVEAELTPQFDATERLKATLAACTPLSLRHADVRTKVDEIEAVMQRPYSAASRPLAAALTDDLLAAVHDHGGPEYARSVEDHVTQQLVEGRHHAECVAFGRRHMALTLRSRGADTTLQAYLPAEVAAELPALPFWSARAVAEVRPPARHDDGRLALRLVALGRVVEL